MANAINWFEIPASDFDRACEFYGKIFNGEINKMDMPGGMKMGMFPHYEVGSVGGAVVAGEGYEPAQKGILPYLNGGDDLAIPLSKVEKAGGKVVMPKTSIGENGFMAQFIDTEGNRVALHSMK